MIRRRKEPVKGVTKKSFSSPVPYTTNVTPDSTQTRRGFRESSSSKANSDDQEETTTTAKERETTLSHPDVPELRSSYLDKLFPTEKEKQVGEVDRPNHGEEEAEHGPPASPLSRWLQDGTPDDLSDVELEHPAVVQDRCHYERGRSPVRRGREDGSVITSGSSYLEDLEEQIRANQTKKAEEAQAEAEFEAKCERERLSMARYGGGGEPLRGPHGEFITATRGTVHWTYDSEESVAMVGRAGSRHSSPSPSQRRTAKSLPSRTPPKPQRLAGNDAKKLPLPKASAAAAACSTPQEALVKENEQLKAEVKRLRAQMDLLMQAFQMERAKDS